MPKVVSTTVGLYPLPNWARDKLASLKGRQKGGLISKDEDKEIETAYDEARSEVIRLQQDVGLDLIVEGQLRWDDMVAHPLSVANGVETGGIIRYYNNNNFYRKPIVTDALEATGDVAAELEAASDCVKNELQAVLPGPWTLADLASDRYYGDEKEFLAAIAQFLAAEAEQFPDIKTLFLLEPSLLESPPREEITEDVSEAINVIASVIEADVVTHVNWESRESKGGLDENVYTHLLNTDVDALGFDLVNGLKDSVHNINEYGVTENIAMGAVNGQNTVIESAADIEERIKKVTNNTPGADFETVYAMPNTGLFYLPVETFYEKLESLATIGKTEVKQ